MKIISYYKKTDKIRALSLILSFFIPFSLILICYALIGIAPFGSGTLCSMDGFSQYYPMLMNMVDSIKSGEIFYSFKGALGFNLWAQSAYYTNSIFWLPLCLIPHKFHLSFIHTAILLKLSLGGLFFSVRLYKIHKNADRTRLLLIFPALSSVWALNGYLCAFINQFMWTDVVILLPLVILGIERLTEKKRPGLYIAALALSLLSCFYLSYMVCIFSVLWFFFVMFREKNGWKTLFDRAVIFGISSLLAGGISAAVILPVYKALGLTKASTLTFDGVIKLKHSLADILLRFLPAQETSLEYGAPNLYCTVTVVFLFLLFLLSKKFSVRHRICTLVFSGFMFISMCINLGEYVWHGFHYPNQLPARQSFLVIFLLIAVAAEFLVKAELSPKALKRITALLLTGAIFNFCIQFSRDVWVSQSNSLQKFEYIMEDFTALDDSEPFTRMEWTGVKKNNYPQQYGYNAVSYYSSTMTEAAYDFFQNIGMERYAKNVSVHYLESDILNSLFSIKYVMSEENGSKITENKNVLPLGFLACEDVLFYDSGNFEDGEQAQQGLWDSLCGKENAPFKEGFRKLSESGYEITLFDTDYIEGKINTSSDGLFFTSIPYDEGWEIFVDGEKAETKKAAGYFLSCSIKQGEHSVILKYTVPGIKAGTVISIACLMLSAAFIIIMKKRND